MENYRIESDLLGEHQLPAHVYYGIQTHRALENFKISPLQISHYPLFIKNLAIVKKAAAQANHALGLLTDDMLHAIEKACDAIADGKYDDAFPIDVFQGGAGTSTNMNINEVIANIVLESMGEQKGNYQIVSPNDHINLSQSTNDAYPTALKLALYDMHHTLQPMMQQMVASLREKADTFKHVIKMGRTQLQDAVPMTLGQEFEAFSVLIEQSIRETDQAAQQLCIVNMGATAIGTGINAAKGFDTKCIEYLSSLKGIQIKNAPNLIAATSDTTCFVEYAAQLKKLALRLIKICNDLRLLSSGPRTGLNEIHLPEMQPGSSIMPGKINPVIPEVVNQICYKVIGNELTVTLAAENGQLQLNVMEPVIASSLFESIELLKNGLNTLVINCIDGITANEQRTTELVMNSIGIVTALNPLIGYKASSEVAKTALTENKKVYDVVLEKGLMDEATLGEYLDPKKMI